MFLIDKKKHVSYRWWASGYFQYSSTEGWFYSAAEQDLFQFVWNFLRIQSRI